MNIQNWFHAHVRESNSRTDRSAAPRLGFVFAVLSILVLPLAAHAQSSVDYRFLEVVETSGKPVVNAKVETNMSSQQTDQKGSVNFPVYSGDYSTTKLKISKPGYFTYEENEVLFSNRYQYLFEGEHIRADHSGPLKIELLKIPDNALERQAAEGEQRKRELLLASKHGDASTVRSLLQAGVDARSTDVDGIPAILWAVTSGRAEAINALLAAGAVPGQKGFLYYLYFATAINDLVSQNLFRAGADINAVDERGQSALMLATANTAANSDEVVKILLASSAAFNAKANDGTTALMKAIGTVKTVEKLKLLLAAGADVNAANERGQTALILEGETRNASHSEEVIKMLVESGATINAKDKDGQTALMVAVGYESRNMTVEKIKALLAAGADADIKDYQGQTALMIARRFQNETVVKLLEAATSP